MSDEAQANSLRQQIYTSMQNEETEKLVKIWQQNDRGEWSDEAFEVIHDILLERLGGVPEPGVGIMETGNMDDSMNRDAIEDTYHNPDKVLKISIWAKVLSWVMLGYGVLRGLQLLFIQITQNMEPGLEFDIPRTTKLTLSANLYLNVFNALLIGVFYFIVLQAISQGLKILMDIWEDYEV